MLRRLSLLGLLALGACTGPQVPDSGAGVGFGDYSQYQQDRARRAAQLRGEAPAGTTVGRESASQIGSQDLAAAGIGASRLADPDRTRGVEATPGNAAPQLVNRPRLSDEQDFEAVAERETIESDAARRERQAAAYEVADTEALPSRSAAAGPNIVSYALQTTNAPGEQVYQRRGPIFGSARSRFQRNCAEYPNADSAQRAFLAMGGPQEDPDYLDPDGDGFACGWNPTAFRAARGG